MRFLRTIVGKSLHNIGKSSRGNIFYKYMIIRAFIPLIPVAMIESLIDFSRRFVQILMEILGKNRSEFYFLVDELKRLIVIKFFCKQFQLFLSDGYRFSIFDSELVILFVKGIIFDIRSGNPYEYMVLVGCQSDATNPMQLP